jgi:hypothetical protein
MRFSVFRQAGQEAGCRLRDDPAGTLGFYNGLQPRTSLNGDIESYLSAFALTFAKRL